jgi:hypothetical protein
MIKQADWGSKGYVDWEDFHRLMASLEAQLHEKRVHYAAERGWQHLRSHGGGGAAAAAAASAGGVWGGRHHHDATTRLRTRGAATVPPPSIDC